MFQITNKFLFIIIFVMGCAGSGGSPTGPDDSGTGGGDSYIFANATNFDKENQIEIISWNIQTFPQLSTTPNYVKSLLETWNADIYLFQEIIEKNTLINMVNLMPEYSYVISGETSFMHFALVYKNANSDCSSCGTVTFNYSNELWSDTPNYNDYTRGCG